MPLGKSPNPQQFQVGQNFPYSEDYKEMCFFAWYNAGKPRGPKLRECLPPDEQHDNRRPAPAMISRWKHEYDWDDRALAMDEEAHKLIEREAIKNRAEMFKRHAKVGEILVETGVEYILEHGIDSANVALRAIDTGSKMETTSLGVSEMLTRVSTMSNDDLLKLANGFLSRLGAGDVIEGEAEEVDEEDEENEED